MKTTDTATFVDMLEANFTSAELDVLAHAAGVAPDIVYSDMTTLKTRCIKLVTYFQRRGQEHDLLANAIIAKPDIDLSVLGGL